MSATRPQAPIIKSPEPQQMTIPFCSAQLASRIVNSRGCEKIENTTHGWDLGVFIQSPVGGIFDFFSQLRYSRGEVRILVSKSDRQQSLLSCFRSIQPAANGPVSHHRYPI